MARLLKSLDIFFKDNANDDGVLGRSTEFGSTPNTVNAGDVGVRKELNEGKSLPNPVIK